MKYLNIIYLFSFIFSQALITEPTEYNTILNEIESLESKTILDQLFMSPYIEKKPKLCKKEPATLSS